MLEDEIQLKKNEITTDGYPMSIGELSSLYKENELDIHPEFQRFFRWTNLQKTKLIESILLGIPIPSIFVSQRTDGVWDVVDGLQRLSTIFEFMGILKNEKGESLEPNTLVATEYLPSLEGKKWEDENVSNSFTPAQRLTFKREKLDIKIVKKESDENVKYELFQRLNTLGSKLSDQEVRNCLLVMINKPFYRWLKDLSLNEDFLETLSLPERMIEEQYNMELALRFIILRKLNVLEIKTTQDLGAFITEKMIEFTKSPEFDYTEESTIFERTFKYLNKVKGELAFKRYNSEKLKFEGKFLLSAFEAIGIGVGRNIETIESKTAEVFEEKLIELWKDETFKSKTGSGVNVTSRVPVIIPLGELKFSF
ncbi:DUF262 domain-containing protein [Flavobacterium buctense]|uniref:DUF262 domain-containing protein n=1 Tax=Flavobacterium buctense TaxID=1648146 RepID=A0ABU9E4F3_9FLAO|nr:DUF262 domain-containing protein [Flavobacterium buctense]